MPAISDVPTSFSYPHAVEDGDEEVHDAMSELASDRASAARLGPWFLRLQSWVRCVHWVKRRWCRASLNGPFRAPVAISQPCAQSGRPAGRDVRDGPMDDRRHKPCLAARRCRHMLRAEAQRVSNRPACDVGHLIHNRLWQHGLPVLPAASVQKSCICPRIAAARPPISLGPARG
jgi:hypothetical protein